MNIGPVAQGNVRRVTYKIQEIVITLFIMSGKCIASTPHFGVWATGHLVSHSLSLHRSTSQVFFDPRRIIPPPLDNLAAAVSPSSMQRSVTVAFSSDNRRYAFHIDQL